MIRKTAGFIVILYFLINGTAYSQTKHAYWDDVQTIKNYDKIYKPPAHPVLFVGSSSIRKWDNVQQVFANYNALNRGIGGAVINDIIYYADDLIFAYQPKQIVIYVGENDLVAESETADTVLNRTIKLFRLIRAKLPDVPIAYISLKPSPSRDKFQGKAIKANLLIKQFLASQQNAAFIDIFPQMLQNGKSRPELFVADMLHMKPEGYAIWQKAVKPYLIKQ